MDLTVATYTRTVVDNDVCPDPRVVTNDDVVLHESEGTNLDVFAQARRWADESAGIDSDRHQELFWREDSGSEVVCS